MPIYEWKCNDCKVYWEDLYKSSEAAPKKRKCPECGKMRNRAFSLFGMRFIGSGFYTNDYGKGNWAHKSQQSAVDEFVEGAKKSSAERMKTGFRNYKVYTPDLKRLEELGQVKRIEGDSDKIIADNADNYREVARQIYQNSDVDPEKQEKTNVDLLTAPDKKGLE